MPSVLPKVGIGGNNMLKAQRSIVRNVHLFIYSLYTYLVWSKYVLHSIILFIYSDVGMIMMQTGMVKQGLNSTSHTYIDGMNKRIQKKTHLLLASFARKLKIKKTHECATYINDNQLCSATYCIDPINCYYHFDFSFVRLIYNNNHISDIYLVWKCMLLFKCIVTCTQILEYLIIISLINR